MAAANMRTGIRPALTAAAFLATGVNKTAIVNVTYNQSKPYVQVYCGANFINPFSKLTTFAAIFK